MKPSIDSIKNEINTLLQSQFPDWDKINKLCDKASFVEDNQDYGYSFGDDGSLYRITCPNCQAKWLIPKLNVYTCENCKKKIRVTYETV
jgi:hypothetical protein